MSFRISRAAIEGRWGPFEDEGARWVESYLSTAARHALLKERGLNRWRPLGLTARLAEVASLVPPGLGVIDVGTDHALLPLALTRAGHAPYALGVDISEGPLRGARARLTSSDHVRLVLADGFIGSQREGAQLWAALGEPHEGLCGCVCGVGGAKVAMMIPTLPFWVRHLVLQPNLQHERVREALRTSGWKVSAERLTIEGERLFLTIAARRDEGTSEVMVPPHPHDSMSLISQDTWYPLWLWVHLEKELSLLSRAVEDSPEARRHFDLRRARTAELTALLERALHLSPKQD